MSDTRKRFSVQSDNSSYFVEGYINENADFKKIEVGEGKLRLNLEQVEYINSIGCKNWLTMIDRVKSMDIEYHAVSIAMMTAISMLPGLLPPGGKGAIKSFILPYYCLNCNQDMTLKISPEELKVVDGSAFVDMHACVHCGNPAVITEENSEYLYLYVEEID